MEVITRCQEGDRNAFALLFEQYKNMVYHTALLMLNDSDEADDVLQEVFVRVHQSLHSYQPEKGAFTTWLHKITVNYCLNLRRKHLFNLIPLDTVFSADRQMKYPSPEEQMDQDDIRSSLQKLSPKLRAVIVLRFYWGLTYTEISQTLDVPIGTVESRLNQALKNIRQSLSSISTGRGYSPANKEMRS